MLQIGRLQCPAQTPRHNCGPLPALRRSPTVKDFCPLHAAKEKKPSKKFNLTDGSLGALELALRAREATDEMSINREAKYTKYKSFNVFSRECKALPYFSSFDSSSFVHSTFQAFLYCLPQIGSEQQPFRACGILA